MRRRPTPPPLAKDNYGCGVALIIVAGVIVYYAWMMGFWGVLPVAIPAAALILYWLYGRILLLRCMSLRAKQGIRGVIVYSNSPNWQTYIETNWLPLFGNRFLVLNRSQGDHRSGTLPARVYRHFCSQNENYCPAVILFRGLMHPYVYRCFHAFRDLKHGNPKALRELEAHLLKQLGIERPPKEEAPSRDGA